MMFFSTYTNDLHFSLKDRPISGEITVDYHLYMAEEKIGNYKINLEFTA